MQAKYQFLSVENFLWCGENIIIYIVCSPCHSTYKATKLKPREQDKKQPYIMPRSHSGRSYKDKP
jgi:hypothetical protein